MRWLLVLLIIFSISCTQPSDDKSIKNNTPGKTKILSKKTPIRLKHVTGDIIFIDAEKHVITIKSHQLEYELCTDDTTVIKIDGEEKTIADIVIGVRATAKYSEVEGKYIAKRIFVASSSTEKTSDQVFKEERAEK